MTILTTHVGSLPREQDVVDVIFAQDDGKTVDDAEFERVIGAAVADRVQRQVDAGVDLVSDGEMSKIGYATYVRHRLSGFELGDYPRATPADLDAFPTFRDRQVASGAGPKYKRPVCRGPITYANHEPLRRDLAALHAAVDGRADITGAFMNAPSPGVVALFLPNEHYTSTDDYLAALAAAMRTEYEAIVAAGFTLQIDAPDLAMGRHIMYRDQPDDVFVARIATHIDALNDALSDIPSDRVRLHVCWGNYEGPHHFDIPVSKIMREVLRGAPSTILFEAANPRHAHEWTVWRDAGDPRRQDPRAGRHRYVDELHRASRAGGRTPRPVRRHRRRRPRRRRDRLRFRHLGGVRPDRPRHLLGQAGNAGPRRRVGVTEIPIQRGHMSDRIIGNHHITLSTGGAQEDWDFYTQTLGMRPVKKTMLYDGAEPVYHLYYTNADMDPGAILTSFPMRQQGKVGRRGSNQVKEVGLSVDESAIDYWANRFDELKMPAEHSEVFGTKRLTFAHPCGIPFTLVGTTGDQRRGWGERGVPADKAIKGSYAAVISVIEPDEMVMYLETGMGAKKVDEIDGRQAFEIDGDGLRPPRRAAARTRRAARHLALRRGHAAPLGVERRQRGEPDGAQGPHRGSSASPTSPSRRTAATSCRSTTAPPAARCSSTRSRRPTAAS